MLGLVKDLSREVEMHMNESDKFFARESMGLYEFVRRSRRDLLDDPDERKLGLMLDFPKPKLSVEHLEEGVKNGLSVRLAVDWYYRIERSARQQMKNCIRNRLSSDSQLAQVRAKFRGEELQSKSEDEIEREASKWVNDLWNEARGHQAAV
jgi:hypothetical protein